MIKLLEKFVIILSLYVMVTLSIYWSVEPFSPLYLIGPFAGLGSALLLSWGLRASPLVLVSLLLIVFLSHWLLPIHIGFELIFIGSLAICLQTFWSYQLGINDVRTGKWLSNRSSLLLFIVKIGPIASIVTATAASILVVLKSQSVTYDLSFTFVAHWALSLLFSVFLVSLSLFSLNKTQVSTVKRIQVFFATFLGIVAIVLLLKVSQKDMQLQRINHFLFADASLREHIQHRIDAIKVQLNSMAGLFIASESVSPKEFELYSSHIFEPESKVEMFAWVPIVAQQSKQALVNHVSMQFYDQFELREPDYINDGNHTQTEFLAPVVHLFPQSMKMRFHGVNLANHQENQLAMRKTIETGEPVVTAPLMGIELGLDHAGVLVYQPIFSHDRHNPFVEGHGGSHDIIGYILALVDVADIFASSQAEINDESISLFVKDVSQENSTILYGNSLATNDRLFSTHLIEMFDRVWRVTIAETQMWHINERSWTTWAMLFGVTLGGLIYQFLILSMTAYSSELKQQVTAKTRELILAKEGSEKASESKSHFLRMLSAELARPLESMNTFVSQLQQQENTAKQQSLIEHIHTTTSHLHRYVDAIKDMSELESGHLSLNLSQVHFHDFIQRMESFLNASSNEETSKVSFIIHQDVPKVILSDELRLRQLFTHLVQNSLLIFNCDSLRISVKAHIHQYQQATVFLVFTPNERAIEDNLTDEVISHEFDALSTTMTIAKEICQRMEGDIKLLPISEHDYMISVSFKAKVINGANFGGNP